jgi:uncharacterized protein (TIGR02301 family)
MMTGLSPFDRRRRSHRRWPAAALLAVSLLVAPVGAAAQPTPYDGDLMRLSEILGALTYLDRLCGSPQAPMWRSRMNALISAQRMNSDDRRRYVDVFNRGMRTFASVHRTCTDRTRSVIEAYLDEGARITDRLDERFGRGPDAAGLPTN